MATVPPVVIVLDISALSVSLPREWLEFSRVGSCYVPQVVYEEMKFLFDRSPDPDLERVARSFNRFYATSGWQITDASAPHPVLKVPSGQAMTKRARVSLAVGKCAYGLSHNFPASLVVLVTSDRVLLQRLYEIQSPNLCGITGSALLQWSRTGQRPIAISQKLQQFRTTTGLLNTGAGNPAYQPTTPQPTKTQKKQKPVIQPLSSSADWLPQLTSMLLALAGLGVAAFAIWAVVSNENLQLEKILNQPDTPTVQPNQ